MLEQCNENKTRVFAFAVREAQAKQALHAKRLLISTQDIAWRVDNMLQHEKLLLVLLASVLANNMIMQIAMKSSL